MVIKGGRGAFCGNGRGREMRDLIVVGIDPGLAATGYGVVGKSGRDIRCLDFGCLKTKTGDDVPARLKQIYEGVSRVLDKWTPDLVAIEEVFTKQAAPSAALSIGQVRGVLLLACGQHDCQVEGIAPRSVKQAISGSGSADKSQIERGLRRLLGLAEQIRPDHAADALGLAYIGAMRR